MAVTFGVLLALAFLAFVVLATLPRYGRIDKRLWWYAYNRYLDSGGWRRLARQVLRRDHYTCQKCQVRATIALCFEGRYTHVSGQPVMEAHHLPGTYRRAWFYLLAPRLGLREDPDDLETLCGKCHAQAHGKGE